MGDAVDDLIEEIIVDAYGEHEQLWSFRQVFEDNARFPFRPCCRCRRRGHRGRLRR
jgi:hypothetical protein